MFSGEKDVVGVSLGIESLQMAHLRMTPQGYRLVNVIKRDLRERQPQEYPRVISAAAQELSIKKGYWVCTIPSNQVTTKNIEIPSLDPQEIRSIIDLQAGRHTPFSREEILVGYITIGVFQRNYTKVLLVIVNRQVIVKQCSLLEEAGVKINRVLFAPEASAKFYAQALNVKPDSLPVGIIDISCHLTDFSIEYNGTIATYRNIPVGLGHLIKEGAPAQEKLIEELQKSIEAYQNEDIYKMPETYILTGDDGKLKELAPLLQDKLKAGVRLMPYLDLVQADQALLVKMVSEYSDDSFLSPIAVAACMPNLQVDLTPDEIKTQRTIEEKGREVIKAGVFSIMLILLVCVLFFSKLYFKSAELGRLKAEYLDKRSMVVKLDLLAQKTRIIKDYINTRLTTLEVINEIYSLIPDEIYLENISTDEKGTINLQGVSEAPAMVFNFVGDLEDSDYFKKVKAKSTVTKKLRGKDVTAFDMELKLESAKDEPVTEEAPTEEGAPGEEPAEGKGTTG